MSNKRVLWQWDNVMAPEEKKAKIVKEDDTKAEEEVSIETPNVGFEDESMSSRSDSLSNSSWNEPIDVDLIDSEQSDSEVTYSSPVVDFSLVIDPNAISNDIHEHYLSLITVSPSVEPMKSPDEQDDASDAPMPSSPDGSSDELGAMSADTPLLSPDPLLVTPPIDEDDSMSADEDNGKLMHIEGQVNYNVSPEYSSYATESEWSDDWSDNEMSHFSYEDMADNEYETSDDDASVKNAMAVSGWILSRNANRRAAFDCAGVVSSDSVDDLSWDED